MLYVNELVVGRDDPKLLHSGSYIYPCAVIVQMYPDIILVSEDGDMLWRDIKESEIRSIGMAHINVLTKAYRRLENEKNNG